MHRFAASLHRCIAAALILLIGHDCLAAEEQAADLVVTDARIYTADPQRAMAEALAVKERRIVFVGRAADVGSWIGPRTRVEHLAGRPQRTLRELSAFVAACAAKYRLPAGKWLTVDEWNYASGNQPGPEYPTLRVALDKASSTNPIQLFGSDGHHGAFNSLALARAKNKDGEQVGLSRQTLARDFSLYRILIGIDERGEPNGARFLGIERETGSIEAGKSADFIVLNQDILNLADQGHADDIRKTGVLETWFMGNPVYISKGGDPNPLKRPN
ncbi:MAG: amidohydrolase family protein [Steroidobacteraceae bacterium]